MSDFSTTAPTDTLPAETQRREASDERMASGWWLVPCAVLAPVCWYGLFRLVF